jgi:drug/metabolite transporter (DMT)-like permease
LIKALGLDIGVHRYHGKLKVLVYLALYCAEDNVVRATDLARLLLLSALWGSSFIFIRLAVPELGPVALVEARVLIAGVTLLIYAAITRQALDLRRHWRQYLFLGAVNSALPFVLISTAELHLSASLAAILNATSPLFGAIVAAIWIGDLLNIRKASGLAIGFLGVAILAGWSHLAVSTVVLLSIGASLLGALCYGLSSVYTKAKVKNAPPLGMAAGSQLFATLVLLPLTPFALPAAWPTRTALLSTLALGFACTALAYLIYFRLIVNIGPVKALTVTFLVPIFGILWGRLFLGEPITFSTLVACAIILVGTALVTGLPLRLPRTSRFLSGPGM